MKVPTRPMPETGFKIAVVTDRALLRFLERQHGLDVEAVRRDIQILCTAGVRFGAPRVIAAGMKFILRDENVVTCYPARQNIEGL